MASTPSPKDCANCGAAEGTVQGSPVHKPCSRCMSAYYCSVKCQKQHWKQGGHKKVCIKKEEEKVERGKQQKAPPAAAAVAVVAVKLEISGTGTPAPAKDHADDDDEEEEIEKCALCLKAIFSAPSKALPCSHVYHIACVEKLQDFGISEVCPSCRPELPAGQAEQLFEDAIRRWWVLDRRYGQQNPNMPWRCTFDKKDAKEFEEVVCMVSEAADQKHAEAQFRLGAMHEHGQGVPRNEATAVKWHRKAAQQGHARAQNTLGFMYEKAKGGLRQNFETAAEWYRKAAQQGLAEAQHNLGHMHRYGQGVRPNTMLAMEWYHKAAAQGMAKAYSTLGEMYDEGRGVRQDLTLAAQWHRKAAEAGIIDSQLYMGMKCADGKGGMEINRREALEWFRKAHAQGHEQAALAITMVLRDIKKERQAAAAAAADQAAEAALNGLD